MKKEEKNYSVSTNINGQIEVSTIIKGKKCSSASAKQTIYYRDKYGRVCQKMETRQQVIKRLCANLGLKY